MSDYMKREDAETAIAGLLNVIEEMPSADVVEVVRCKDCRCFDQDRELCNDFFGMGSRVTENDYCSAAEPK